MQISWFTVIAQIINFLVLVWLLKRFLYKPVLKAIDDREKKIVERLEEAELQKTAAKKEKDEFAKKNADFDRTKSELMESAVLETNRQKELLTEDALIAVDKLQAKRQKYLTETAEKFSISIAEKAQQEVFDISRRVLKDLASVRLEDQVASLFVSQIQELEGEAKSQFISSFKSTSSTLLVQSAFELTGGQQQGITQAVDEILGIKQTFQFKTSPEMISGIELTGNGYKLEWNISAYLDALHSSVKEMSKREMESEQKSVKDKVNVNGN
ncbi:F0F1 ATP synthase subunit B [Sphingobacterium alkalisoli]|uniref:ATP synthase subunit b n=1 Tax=Sphingobacterium alkalisoli TaxID=1874115 RepID=A0A4U0H677_9SPHI|nr:F0F1 ATP synthase subunit B [Sphingobacterium alkalisoli]TJY66764.1 F0F1 ATP synthase subunit B [Sphingobacterium alkalisoli]GGH14357.1 ATP synthase subunit B [Sphingobacterium alkalisoli]